MVRGFLNEEDGVKVSEQKVGELTGILGACFCAAQLFTSYPIGKLSDRIGRRPIILLGNLVCVVSTILFGLSRTYMQAVCSRILGGLFNAIIGAEKAIIGESLSPEQQSIAMSHISAMWGIGTLLGPAIGGALSHPCQQHTPILSSSTLCSDPNGILRRYPFVAPCLAAAFLSLIALFLTAFFLEESKGKADYSQVSTDDFELHSSERKRYWNVENGRQEIELIRSVAPHGVLGAHPMQAEKIYHSNEGVDGAEDVDPEHDVEHSNLLQKHGKPRLAVPGKGFERQDQQPVPSVGSWHHQPNVLLCLAGYAIIAFCYILLDEITPIFASSPKTDGGLGWQTSALAAPLSFGGLVLIAWAAFGYPPMVQRYGPLRVCRLGLWLTIPMSLLIPFSSIAFSMPTMWVAMASKSITGVISFTPCLTMVNVVAPKHALGEVNGVGQTLASGVRALGPALGGMSWALSLQLFESLGLPPQGHQFLPFGISVLAAIGAHRVYARVKLPEPKLIEQNEDA